MKKLLFAFAVLVLVSCAALWVLLSRAVDAPGGEGPEVFVEVRKGASARSVARQLEQAGLARALLFRFAVWRRGGLQLKAGQFRLSPKLSPSELAAALEASPLAEDEPFSVIEGWRRLDVDEALFAAGRAQRGDYLAATSSGQGYRAPFTLPSDSLEGFLYPETYHLPKGRIDARELVQKQLDLFTQRIFSPLAEELNKSKRSLRDVITMASLLEREEPTPSNRPIVAGILWKRLDRGFPLGVDATSRYELPEWNERAAFLRKLRDASDKYNTRTRPGLPPTPIGAPTRVSVEAALWPAKTDYLYYLHDASKQLHPSRNAEEHERLRKQYSVY